MPRDVLIVLFEIVAAIDGIDNATRNKTVDDLAGDWLLKHGIERGLEIISEASRHIPDDLIAGEPDIPWKQIRGLGNVFRHEYHNVADPILWTVVTDSLPPLRAAIERILAKVSAIRDGSEP